jgi:hypothetical protein
LRGQPGSGQRVARSCSYLFSGVLISTQQSGNFIPTTLLKIHPSNDHTPSQRLEHL